MKTHVYKKLGILLSAILLLSGCKDEGTFDNNVYLVTPTLEIILNKPSVTTDERTLQIGIAKPEAEDIRADFTVDPSLVARYNKAHSEQAILLSEEYYSLTENSTVIAAGSVISNPVTVHFDKINTLDMETVYVLPVRVANTNLSVLESESITYYVVRGGALINVVADLEDNYLYTTAWKNATPLNGLTQFTLEALIRARNFDRMISTIMGIEGNFLIRLGDANFPPNQIQVATSAGNMPTADASTKGLDANQWVHIAVTFQGTAPRSIKVYVNGNLQSEASTTLTSRNLGTAGLNGFQIGRSYADDRFLAGEFAECRIWNVERTPEEIAANPYNVPVDSPGLVAYWKCDDGAGNIVKDHTANENHLISKSAIRWTPVSLPEKK